MKGPGRISRRYTLSIAAVASVLFVVPAFVLIVMSASGRVLFDFEDDESAVLAAEELIAARISFDRESYLIGDIARYRVRLAWRHDRVRPDLRSLATSIGFFPFDHRGQRITRNRQSGNVREYTAEYVLQAVNVETPASYQLDTVTVYYTFTDDANREVHALRANAPQVHVGEYYPANIASIELLPPKPAIDDARTLRRALMGVCALALALVAAALLWSHGRKRPYARLSAAEKLWRELCELRRDSASDRRQAMRYEKLATRALELRAGITPLEFWSGKSIESGESQDVLVEARRLLGEAYKPGDAPAGDGGRIIERIAGLIETFLQPMIDEARLEREARDDVVLRLRQQPKVLVVSGGLLFAAICALTLAALPSLWLPAELRLYNDAVLLIESGEEPQRAVDAFADLAEIADDPRVRSAALYNLGTVLADARLSRLSREQHRNFLQAMFLPKVTLNRLLHDMELDAEFELLTLLTELTRQYVQAEQALKAAVRAGPADSDISRNLEILGKIRRAIAGSLAQLIAEGEQGAGQQLMVGQTIIDLKLLMESELPDEFARTDEGRDDRNYFIMERF